MEVTWQEVMDALDTLQPVEGGFTSAQRGIVTLKSGGKLFVKRAVDKQTAAWIELEKKAYSWLNLHDYKNAPRMVAEGEGGLALPDLSDMDWSNEWTAEKLDTALGAMDSLAALSAKASEEFDHYKDVNHWLNLPLTISKYKPLSSDDQLLIYVSEFLSDGLKRRQLTAAANNHPECGETLVHLDVRADNFCYDATTGHGYLVDWNWLCLANEALDVNGLLVSVTQRGFDVLKYAGERLHRPSLASLAGFWLNAAIQPESDPQATRRHKQQFEAAVTALRLYEQL